MPGCQVVLLLACCAAHTLLNSPWASSGADQYLHIWVCACLLQCRCMEIQYTESWPAFPWPVADLGPQSCCTYPAESLTLRLDLVTLQYTTTTNGAYLGGGGPQGLGPLRHVGLYCAADALSGNAVYALHMPASNRSGSPHNPTNRCKSDLRQ